MESQNSTKLLVYLILGISIIMSIYLVVSGLVAANTTGLLIVKTNSKSAVLSVSQADHKAAVIGVGSAKTHLEPGNYLLSAESEGNQTSEVIIISKKHTLTKNIKITGKPHIPSVLDIDFKNTSSLTDGGLNSTQLINFEQHVFNFMPSASKVIIDSSSVSPGAYDRNDPNAQFSLNFNASIDSKDYRFTLKLIGLDGLQTFAYDTNGNLLFDSSANSSE